MFNAGDSITIGDIFFWCEYYRRDTITTEIIVEIRS